MNELNGIIGDCFLFIFHFILTFGKISAVLGDRFIAKLIVVMKRWGEGDIRAQAVGDGLSEKTKIPFRFGAAYACPKL